MAPNFGRLLAIFYIQQGQMNLQGATRGHFDLPMMGCDIRLDDRLVVSHGKLVS